MPEVDIVAELNAVAQNVELDEAADDASRLATLQLLASSFAHNLHIDARITEQDVFVLLEVGRVVLIDEVFLADRRYLAHVADKVIVFVSDYDVSFKERLDCLVFLILLLGISFAVAARCNRKQ